MNNRAVIAVVAAMFFAAYAKEPVHVAVVPSNARWQLGPMDPLYLEALYERVSAEDEAALWEQMPVESIVLESSGCYGSCPSYTVSFHRGGVAQFEGRSYVDELDGSFRGRIHVSEFALLCLFLERLRFTDLDPAYAATWTDDNAMTMTVTYSGGETPVEVLDYGRQAPPEFFALVLAVEDASRKIEWKPDKPR